MLIPFGDTVGFVLVSLLVGCQNPWLGLEVLLVCLVIDQVTDNAIAPRLLGELVGLNPVWILLSLLLGAKLAGILGVFVAVPLAGTVKYVLDEVKAARDENRTKDDLVSGSSD
ncbi:MAG: AI-2E family transporter [Leptolyngbyaceae cyanobacterium SM2_3_12]|nr:AI-2E family transporter [Leptolyngbyaceae cyanobacterium SM2_3_12]